MSNCSYKNQNPELFTDDEWIEAHKSDPICFCEQCVKRYPDWVIEEHAKATSTPTPRRGRPRALHDSNKRRIAALPPLLTGGEINDKLWDDRPRIHCEQGVYASIDYFTCSLKCFDVPRESKMDEWEQQGRNPFDGGEPLDTQYKYHDQLPSNTVNDHLEIYLSAVKNDFVIKPLDGTFLFCKTSWGVWAKTANLATGELLPDTLVGRIGLHISKNTTSGFIDHRWIISITGSQCPYWDFAKVRLACHETHAVITRLDIAVDDLLGQISYESVDKMEKKGYFVNRRPLASDEKGARTPEKGRTLYVGNRENGKQLCIYEKGKQTSDLIHPNWIRWEFRVGNKDGRVIPYEVLTNPSAFFLGAFRSFPYIFRNLTDATPEIIKTQQDRLAVATVDAWVNNAKRSYGAGLGVLEKLGVDTAKLFCVLTRDGLQNSLGLPDSLSAIDTVDHLYSQLHDTSLSIDNP